MATVPDPRHAHEEDARVRAFVEAMQRLADEPGLREELAEACGHATLSNELGHDVVLWAMIDPAGQEAAAAVRLVLARRRLPQELVQWGVTLGVCGAASPSTAIEYLMSHVAPSEALEKEPVTGQRQIVLRIPVDWSARRIHEWERRAVARLRAASILGEPVMSTPRGGASIKASRAEAIAAAQRFDEQYAAKLSSQSGRLVVPLKKWLREFDAWLADGDETRLGTASSLWKLHLRDAVRRGDFLPATIAFRPRTRRARK